MSNYPSFKELSDKFITACENGEINVIKELHEKLLNEQEFSRFYFMTISDALNSSIDKKNWHIVKYLLEEKNHDLCHDELLHMSRVLYSACANEQINLVRYVLEQNKVNDLNIDLEPAFNVSFNQPGLEIAKVFIFEYNIEKDAKIQTSLDLNFHGNSKEINKMFQIREFKQSLNKELTQKSSVDKKSKI
jgi:hypothetical protein